MGLLLNILGGKKALASRVPGKNFASFSVIFFDHRVNYRGHKKLEALPAFYQSKKLQLLSYFTIYVLLQLRFPILNGETLMEIIYRNTNLKIVTCI